MLHKTALELLTTFFSKTSGDTVLTSDIYTAANRSADPIKNKAWLTNRISRMKAFNFIKPVYGKRDHANVLIGVKLTGAGKIALGRTKGNPSGTSAAAPATEGNHEITMKEVMAAIPRIRKENPEFEIVFDVKLKNG